MGGKPGKLIFSESGFDPGALPALQLSRKAFYSSHRVYLFQMVVKSACAAGLAFMRCKVKPRLNIFHFPWFPSHMVWMARGSAKWGFCSWRYGHNVG
jgi:hypothetical protein